MKIRTSLPAFRTLFLVAGAVLWYCVSAPAQGRGPDLHLCQIVTGERVAEAVHGRIKETRAAEGRCVYVVTLPEGVANATFVLYRHDAGDYGELRDVLDGEITRLDGLGDEAVLSFEPDAKRYWVLAVIRGLVTLQVSGGDKEQVRQVAAAALEQLAGK